MHRLIKQTCMVCLLQIGDASGIQSPISFGGFGAITRHIGRLSNGKKISWPVISYFSLIQVHFIYSRAASSLNCILKPIVLTNVCNQLVTSF